MRPGIRCPPRWRWCAGSTRCARLAHMSTPADRMIDLVPPVERAFLVAVDTRDDPGWTAAESVDELAALARTAGAEVVGAEWQRRRHVDPHFYLGKGKAEELKAVKGETGFTLLVADDELTPNQQKSLEERLAVKVIRGRIRRRRERVEGIRTQRDTAARARRRRLLETVAIVGYTNAGKSTMLNALAGSEAAYVEDKPFATLDPTSRLVRLGEGQGVIVSDTVGFIHKLPHQLVDAFRATLDEVTRADLVLEVVDAADSHVPEHRAVVQAVLDELGAGTKPRVVAFNKADLLSHTARDRDAGTGGRRDGPGLGAHRLRPRYP